MEVNKNSTEKPRVGGIIKFVPREGGHCPNHYFLYKIVSIGNIDYKYEIIDSSNVDQIGRVRHHDIKNPWDWNNTDFIVTYKNDRFDKLVERMKE